MLNIFSINGSINGKIIPHEDGSIDAFSKIMLANNTIMVIQLKIDANLYKKFKHRINHPKSKHRFLGPVKIAKNSKGIPFLIMDVCVISPLNVSTRRKFRDVEIYAEYIKNKESVLGNIKGIENKIESIKELNEDENTDNLLNEILKDLDVLQKKLQGNNEYTENTEVSEENKEKDGSDA